MNSDFAQPQSNTILVIDDDPIMRSTLEDLLHSRYDVILSENGIEGLAKAEKYFPDVILLDVMMPGLDGFEVCRRIRAHPELSEVPIIMITALDDRSSLLTGLRAGADEFLTKPFDSVELAIRLQTLVKLNRYRRLVHERKQVESVLQQHNRELVLLNQAAQIFSSTLDLDQVLFSILDEVRHVTGAIGSSIWLLESEGGELVCREAAGPTGDVLRNRRLPISQGLVGWVTRSGESVLTEDANKDNRHYRDLEVEIGVTVRSLVTVPLRLSDQIIGALQVIHSEPNFFKPSGVHLMEALAATAAIAVENARLFTSVSLQREQLRQLAARLAENDESARLHIAQELHDRVGQDLTALGLNLSLARNQGVTACDGGFEKRIDDSLSLVAEITRRLRDVLAELRPPLLDDYGLHAALRVYLDQFSRRTGIRTLLIADEAAPRMSAPVETTLFRIVQESVTNVAKHAHAGRVTVEIKQSANHTNLIIRDDGQGFDLYAPNSSREESGSWGLLLMRERATAIGGQFNVESALGIGTEITVGVPI